jgi:glycosyltransferase involved in cell wall biosynthesis
MAAEPPAISVVIPCYNQGQFLDEAVDSVLAQTRGDFEIIVVNDGSSDPVTVELLERYDRPRTRVLTTPNRGLAAARNLGIREAKGRYLCALDADDVLLPTAFERAAGLLDGSPELAFASFWLENFGEIESLWQPTSCDLPTLLGECTVSTSALVRKTALEAVGTYDEGMPLQGYEDWDLWITLVERGHAGAIIPEVLFRYRRRPDSMSAVCCSGNGHLALMEYLVDKHAASYERHLGDVLRVKDRQLAVLLTQNDKLERHIHTVLKPAVALRTEEAHRLARRAGATTVSRPDETARLREVEQALAAAQNEIAALRDSKSWKVTAPLRAAYEVLLRLGRTTG